MTMALGFFFVVALVLVVVLVAWVGSRLRPVERHEVEQLADLADLDVTADNVVVLVESVARTRLWRTVGLLVAGACVAVAIVWGAVQGEGLTFQLLFVLWCLVGYWAGSVVAEVATARAAVPAHGPRVASLVRRERSSYVGGWAVVAPWWLGALGGAGALVLAALGVRDLGLLAFGLGAVLVAVIHAAVSRYVLERRRPGLAPDVAAADDAVRSRSLHALGGAAVGIGVWTASGSLGAALLAYVVRSRGFDAADLDALGDQTFAVVMVLCALVVPLVGLVAGRRLARRPFPLARTGTAEVRA